MENVINGNSGIPIITNKLKEKLVFIVCLICLSLLLSTAYFKLVEHDQFKGGLSRIHALKDYAVYISWMVPIAEILVAVLLIIPQTVKLGLYGFLTLMTIFTLYIIGMFLFAKNMPCHCGGAIEKLSWTQHLWFNIGFIILAILGTRLSKNL